MELDDGRHPAARGLAGHHGQLHSIAKVVAHDPAFDVGGRRLKVFTPRHRHAALVILKQ